MGISNQSCIAKNVATKEEVIACFDKTNELLGQNIDYKFCPHEQRHYNCYCRKPQAGLAAEFIEKYKLNPEECIFVGDQPSDMQLAEKCGFRFYGIKEFFYAS